MSYISTSIYAGVKFLVLSGRTRLASVLIQLLGKQRQQGAIVLNYSLEDVKKNYTNMISAVIGWSYKLVLYNV